MLRALKLDFMTTRQRQTITIDFNTQNYRELALGNTLLALSPE